MHDMYSIYGKYVWQQVYVCMASMYGKYVWHVCMACTNVCMASMYGPSIHACMEGIHYKLTNGNHCSPMKTC